MIKNTKTQFKHSINICDGLSRWGLLYNYMFTIRFISYCKHSAKMDLLRDRMNQFSTEVRSGNEYDTVSYIEKHYN